MSRVAPEMPDRLQAPASFSEPARGSDVLWLLLALAVLVGTGVGIRDPWPADEPRFALIARDMVASGEWLFPHVAGNLYTEKPPLFFWLLGVSNLLTGWLRAAFLLPSLIASGATLWLIYDLSRRLFGRAAALAASLTLACTVQFLVASRSAQIDATLCALVALSLYGFLRHLLLGPAWGWYFIGGLSAGLGVITKGVGFLPVLVLLPYALLRRRGFEFLPSFRGGAQWVWAPAGLLLGIAIWLVPMLLRVATAGDPQLVAYRDEILLEQTVERYAAAWHHVKPWYYFLLEVIPPLWLPVSVLLVWLIPRWKHSFAERDARVWLPLAWSLLVLVFFSLSSGKRGIYILPALPAVMFAAAPFLPTLYRTRTVQITSLVLGAVLIVPALVVLVGEAAGFGAVEQLVASFDFDWFWPVLAYSALAVCIWVAAWRWRPLLAWPAVLASLAVVFSYGVAPQITDRRSGRTFITSVLARVPPSRELAFVNYKEQFYLYTDRPTVNFGHRRWLEGLQEPYDASKWLNAAPGRVLLVPEELMAPCFTGAPHELAGETGGDPWFLVEAPADTGCAARGNLGRATVYVPPPGATDLP